MIISLDPAFVFIHVPKTAGYSLELALSQYVQAPQGVDYRWFNPFHAMRRPDPLDTSVVVHSPANSMKDLLDPEFLARAFTFGFVRNPWEWLVSYYSFGKVSGPREARPQFVARFPTFKTWVEEALLVDNPWLEETYRHYAYRIKIPQHFYLLKPEGGSAVDFIGRYENLQSDFETACHLALISAPPVLGSTHRSSHGPYQEYYDEETRELVEPVVGEDARSFGYSFV